MKKTINWELAQALFEQLCDETPSYRQQYLQLACEDTKTRQAVKDLLQSHDKANQENWLDRPAPATYFQEGDKITLGDSSTETDTNSKSLVTNHKYRVKSLLGQGGMSEVYWVEHEKTKQTFALKILAPHYSDQTSATERFEQEATLLKRLQHPNICCFEGFTHYSDTLHKRSPCLLMEYCPGKELNKLIEQGPIPLPQALQIMSDITAGLGALHQKQIWHRDLKPNNVIISDDNTIKLVDLGIAKEETIKLTKTGMRLGTPSYMAPEQWLGKPVDQRTDLWALGVIGYEMISGTNPFKSTQAMMLASEVTNETPDKIELSPPNQALSSDINHMLSKLITPLKEDRYFDTRELQEVLCPLLERA